MKQLSILFLISVLGLTPAHGGNFYRNIKAKQAEKLILEHAAKGDLIILDVRSPGEFEKGFIKGAININFWDKDFVDSVSKLDPKAIYLVYCASRVRSSGAMKKMKSLGFEQIYNMKGGMFAWRTANLPVKSRVDFDLLTVFPYLEPSVKEGFMPIKNGRLNLGELERSAFFDRKEAQDGTVEYGDNISFKTGFRCCDGKGEFIKMEYVHVKLSKDGMPEQMHLCICMDDGWAVERNNKSLIEELGPPIIERFDQEERYLWKSKPEILIISDYTGSGRFHIYLNYKMN
jgi:rhodanese-related sulfurtransferase